MCHLTIAICTADRPRLLGDLLAALAAATPGTWAREVVVADNGSHGDTASVIAAHDSPALPLRRVAAPPYNIARARNAALAAATGELVLWLDDDQLVGPGFFIDLERAWRHRPAWSDGLRLTFAPRFEGVVPALVRAWFTPEAQPEGAPANRRSFSTNGLLAPRVGSLAVRGPTPEGPFDPWFGTRGGEDTDFFLRASAAGLRFSTTRLAAVEERVTPERARVGYMARTAFRIGFTDTVISRRERGWLRLTAEAAVRAAFDATLAPLAVGDKDALQLRALSVCRQAGKLWALAGGDFEHYRRG